MRRFAELYAALDATTRTGQKVAALRDYFAAAPPADAAWAVQFLSGRRPKRLVGYGDLRIWAAEAAALPDWLVEECRHAVGDLAETIALLVPTAGDGGSDLPLHLWVEERLLPLKGMEPAEKRAALLAAWSELDERQTFVWNKLLTGAFRVGVSRKLVVRALAEGAGLDPAVVAHRLMGRWEPSAEAFERLVGEDTGDADVSRPYPFFLAHPLEDDPGELAALADRLGPVADWQAEWKWDGIRSQIVRREGRVFVWSRGEELVTERFPEVAEAARAFPDGTVIDGELMAWRDGPLPFALLQRRIGRKTLGPKMLAEVPVALVAYDLLEDGGEDVRERPLAWRRERLGELVAGAAATGRILLSPVVEVASWEELVAARERAREEGAEGLMLKRRDAAYGVGRRRGPWWKWKVDPYTVDAVLLYAQRGSGRRASLYTDYTFGIWDGDALVPFAKAYSGLTDAEIRQVDRFVRRNTRERFGPVRSVAPELVFELAFEGIRPSTRHKSGVAVRFPRMARWRKDKKPEDADTLETVKALIDT